MKNNLASLIAKPSNQHLDNENMPLFRQIKKYLISQVQLFVSSIKKYLGLCMQELCRYVKICLITEGLAL
jgi:hypothetical protein